MLTFADPRLKFVFFFNGNNRSPTDRREHFQHTNTAFATTGVWIADEESPLVRLLASLGARIEPKKVLVPTV